MFHQIPYEDGTKEIIKSYRSPLNHRLFDINEINRLNRKINGDDNTDYYKILKSKKTRYKSLELFATGTAAGFHHAGIQNIFINDIDKDCIST